MSRSRRNHRATMAASSAGRRVRRVAQVKPAAAHMKPFAQRTGAAAKRRVRRTRAWAAPRVECSGQVLQDSVAPTVSAWLSAAARRLEPAKPQRPRWRKLAGFAVLAAGAAAALVRNRKKPDSATPAAATGAGNVAPATAMSDGQATASTGADADGQVRTS
jgi:hypothetical protein